eukprot:SAG31_NODE_421_length_15868_cov_8.966453_13_plen_79_part_00
MQLACAQQTRQTFHETRATTVPFVPNANPLEALVPFARQNTSTTKRRATKGQKDAGTSHRHHCGASMDDRLLIARGNR